jgi:WD40 repeat protein
MAFNSEGTHLASGDRQGFIRIHDIENSEMLTCINAHDHEVVCLAYNNSDTGNGTSLLSSGSRDRILVMFNASQNYDAICALDDHQSSITSVGFITEWGKDGQSR